MSFLNGFAWFSFFFYKNMARYKNSDENAHLKQTLFEDSWITVQ